MGGAQAGEVASSLAANALKERGDGDTGDGERRVAELIQEANRRVHQRALDDEAASGMGTTMTVALFHEDGTVAIGHVGDSRAYLLREDVLEQVTDDHSWAAGQVRAGALAAEEARHHPKRNLIERAVMGDPVEVDVFEVDAQAGDVLLLCSDGLWEPLADPALGAVIASPDPLGVVLTRACDAALAGGGTDNVTVVAARWLPGPSATV